PVRALVHRLDLGHDLVRAVGRAAHVDRLGVRVLDARVDREVAGTAAASGQEPGDAASDQRQYQHARDDDTDDQATLGLRRRAIDWRVVIAQVGEPGRLRTGIGP